MSEPFLAEIRIASFSFAPKGWAFCNGQLLLINQNQALFSILGTNYGGNGILTFALPDLRGRAPAHIGSELQQQGQVGGVESVTLALNQLAGHSHSLASQNALATTADPSGSTFAKKPRFGKDVYAPPNNPTPLNAGSLGAAGGTGNDTAAHENMQPSLTLNFIIALQGIFPSRN